MYKIHNALVTQWFRVPRLHRGGRWFESNREHKKNQKCLVSKIEIRIFVGSSLKHRGYKKFNKSVG